jgi:hypothetical protein
VKTSLAFVFFDPEVPHHAISLTTQSLLGINIFLSILFSDTCNLCPPLNVRDHISHSYKVSGKITIIYHFIYVLPSM